MNHYKNLIIKHQEEFAAFPVEFAFSEAQFSQLLSKFGLNENETNQLYSIGSGGYIKKTDSSALSHLLERHTKELEDQIKEDETGMGFIYDMFVYELNNHEYGYTGTTRDTLDALNLSLEEIKANAAMLAGFNKACKDCR